MKGSSSVRWCELLNRGKAKTNVTFEGKQFFINSKIVLFENHQSSLQPGTHTFEFECQLPNKIPASFESVEGKIRYCIEVVVNNSWMMLNDRNVTTKYFLVRRRDLIQGHPRLTEPIKKEKSKKFGLMFKSNPLLITLSTPFSAYTHGDDVVFKIVYKNQSNVEITHTNIKFRRILKLTSQSPMVKAKLEYKKLFEVRAEGVKANSAKTFEKSFSVPYDADPSNSKYCHNVQIFYEIVVTAVSAGFHKNIELAMPVRIMMSSHLSRSDAPPEYHQIFEETQESHTHNHREY